MCYPPNGRDLKKIQQIFIFYATKSVSSEYNCYYQIIDKGIFDASTANTDLIDKN